MEKYESEKLNKCKENEREIYYPWGKDLRENYEIREIDMIYIYEWSGVLSHSVMSYSL